MPMAVPMKTTFNAGEISPLMMGRITHTQYVNGCRQLINFFVRPHGGAVRRPGTRFMAEIKDSSTKARLLPFSFSVFQSYILEMGDGYLRFFTNQGQVVTGATPYEIAVPYTSGDLPSIKHCQSADRMFLAQRNHAPQVLTRAGHTNWDLGDIAFGTGISVPADVTLAKAGSGAGVFHEYVVTALDDALLESRPCASLGTDHANVLSYSNHISLSWGPVPDAAEYRVYKNKDNNGVFGYLGRTTGATFYDKGTVGPDVVETPPEAYEPFDSENNYPGAISFHEQRLCFAGTNNEPQTIWMSKTGDPTNLDRSSPSRFDDSCKFTLNADQMNLIRWMVSSRMLLLGTSGAEWHLSGGTSGAITPTSVAAQRETQHGSADIQPVVIGNVVLFVDRAGRTVRGYVYQLDMDGYAGPNLSILAEHLTRSNSIVDWAFQQSGGLVWCARDDGLLLSLTYEKDHEVVAWARHETLGKVESVCAIPGEERDEVWLVVRRTVNGQVRRFVELLEAEYDPTVVEAGQADTTNAYFVDSGLTYNQPVELAALATSTPVTVTLATAHDWVAGDHVRLTGLDGPVSLNGRVFEVANPGTYAFDLLTLDGESLPGTGLTPYESGGRARKMVSTISGLDHLAGETVSILADGAVHPDKTVSSGGTVILDWPASVVHAGLPYESTLEPTPMEVPLPDGTSQSRTARISKITARVYQSLGLLMGPEEDRLDRVSFRTSTDPMGRPPSVFSGDVDLTWPGGWNRRGRILIRQDQPLPLTLLALIPRVHTSGR